MRFPARTTVLLQRHLRERCAADAGGRTSAGTKSSCSKVSPCSMPTSKAVATQIFTAPKLGMAHKKPNHEKDIQGIISTKTWMWISTKNCVLGSLLILRVEILVDYKLQVCGPAIFHPTTFWWLSQNKPTCASDASHAEQLDNDLPHCSLPTHRPEMRLADPAALEGTEHPLGWSWSEPIASRTTDPFSRDPFPLAEALSASR